MPIPTVASLCAALGQHLGLHDARARSDAQISAVHISELVDPTPYLAGGELLLTLGMSLPTSAVGCRRYVAGLKRTGVSALGLGLGPVHDSVPDVLARACIEHGLPLLVVPPRTPFLTVTNAFWKALASSSERHLNDAIATHKALVDAAASADPVATMLAKLARWLGGWAATLDVVGQLNQIHPPGYTDAAEALESEVRRLEVAGVHSAASFATADSVVVVFPLVVAQDIVGYLAVGTEHQLDTSQRAVVLAACGLLSLDALRERGTHAANVVRRQSVALLLDEGLVEAAQRLAGRQALGVLEPECRVISLIGRSASELEEVVHRSCPEMLGSTSDRHSAWFVIPGSSRSLESALCAVRHADSTARGAVSELIRLGDIGPVRVRQGADVARMPEGQIRLPRQALTARSIDAALDRLQGSAGQNVQALAAFLRCRSQWEPAARELGIHRNTMRYRVARALEALDLDLNDADVSAEVWLAMRDRGLA